MGIWHSKLLITFYEYVSLNSLQLICFLINQSLIEIKVFTYFGIPITKYWKLISIY